MICVVNPCVQTGCRRGRVDAFVCVLRDILTMIRTREPRSLVCVYVCVRPQTEVQSTDKNFMVPVGGAIVAGPSSTLVDKACNLALAVLLVPRAMCMDFASMIQVSGLYPGRASMSPVSLGFFLATRCQQLLEKH